MQQTRETRAKKSHKYQSSNAHRIDIGKSQNLKPVMQERKDDQVSEMSIDILVLKKKFTDFCFL